jgi:hypothetical protein
LRRFLELVLLKYRTGIDMGALAGGRKFFGAAAARDAPARIAARTRVLVWARQVSHARLMASEVLGIGRRRRGTVGEKFVKCFTSWPRI